MCLLGTADLASVLLLNLPSSELGLLRRMLSTILFKLNNKMIIKNKLKTKSQICPQANGEWVPRLGQEPGPVLLQPLLLIVSPNWPTSSLP